ncbi:MAG: ABC transporter permease [Eubacteriales bacterium]
MPLKISLKKREHIKTYHKILSPIFSVLVAFLLIGIMLECMGYSAVKSYTYLFKGAFGSAYNISESILQGTPLLLASLGVAVALSMSTMNIGAEGQYAVGAWAATGIAVFCPGIPQNLVLPVMVLAGFAAGSLWGVVAVLPRAKWGVNETITTLMFNYIALQWNDYWIYGPWRDSGSLNLPLSPVVPTYAMFATFFGTRVNFALIIGLFFAVVLYLYLRRTASGYEIRVIGQNRKAATYAGMNIGKRMLLVMVLSGGLAGLAGVAQIAGAGTRLISDVAGGTGYMALIVARLSKNNPLLIVVISLLFGGLTQGAYNLQLAQVPWQMTEMLQGAILFCALAGELFITNRVSITWEGKGGAVSC